MFSWVCKSSFLNMTASTSKMDRINVRSVSISFGWFLILCKICLGIWGFSRPFGHGPIQVLKEHHLTWRYNRDSKIYLNYQTLFFWWMCESLYLWFDCFLLRKYLHIYLALVSLLVVLWISFLSLVLGKRLSGWFIFGLFCLIPKVSWFVHSWFLYNSTGQ